MGVIMGNWIDSAQNSDSWRAIRINLKEIVIIMGNWIDSALNSASWRAIRIHLRLNECHYGKLDLFCSKQGLFESY